MPAAWNHSAISWLSAAAPEMKKRTRPPKRWRTFPKTRMLNSSRWSGQDRAGVAALALGLVVGQADLEGPLEDRLLGASLSGLHGDDPAVRLLEDPRAQRP